MFGWILLAIGIAIIAGLSIYAGRLVHQLHQQKKALREAQAKHQHYLHQSIETIALAMQQEQCPLSEGCIRIAVLLDNLPEAEAAQYQEAYPHIHKMYERIQHMPTHEARKQRPRNEIMRLDREREMYEAEMEQDIQQDVQAILTWVRQVKQPV